MKKYTALGIMSGTSLDGLDLCLASFTQNGGGWKFNILKAETVPYSDSWKEKLSQAVCMSASQYVELDFEYGRFIGQQAKRFLQRVTAKADLIASHGHTVFHQPSKGFTAQIGHGAAIAAATRIPTICDFRSMDLALGGQGAPLVPMGDEQLFSDFPLCLNLGGFSNISYLYKKKRIAFDICPVNTLLNRQAKILGMEFDLNGDTGRQGKEIGPLLHALNTLPYYSSKPPKSLGIEWVNQHILPMLEPFKEQTENILHTFYLHMAAQIAQVLNKASKSRKKVLITGGGAKNNFLIEQIRLRTHHELVLPAKEIIDFKESLIFAFLGVLRMRTQTNCLSSVTGAGYDSSTGAMHIIQ